MKRAGNLYDAIADRDNLRAAFHKACRGKRHRAETRRFAANLDANLAGVAARLAAGTFAFGRFTQFVIRDPKERVITAPCFEERVAHHSVTAVVEPHLDRWLIADTFACRKGKGRGAAVERAAGFASRYRHFLKVDVRKYFDSVPHDRLLERLARRFKDRRLLDLFARVVGSYRGDLGRGLPIGSLMSQHFANFYLGWFDRAAKDGWRVPGYVRYMDDVIVWSDDPAELAAAAERSAEWLGAELGLELKPPHRNRTAIGADFLGCRVFPGRVVLNRRSRVRFRRKLAALEAAAEDGSITGRELQSRAGSLVAFARAAGVRSWRVRSRAVESTAGGGRTARTG